MKEIVIIPAHGSGASIHYGPEDGPDGRRMVHLVEPMLQSELGSRALLKQYDIRVIPPGGINCTMWARKREKAMNAAVDELFGTFDTKNTVAIIPVGFSKGAYEWIEKLNELRECGLDYFLDRMWPILVDAQIFLGNRNGQVLDLAYDFQKAGRGEYIKQAFRSPFYKIGEGFNVSNIRQNIILPGSVAGREFEAAIDRGNNPHNFIRHSTAAKDMYKRVIRKMIDSLEGK